MSIKTSKTGKVFIFLILTTYLSTYFLNFFDKNKDEVIGNIGISHLLLYIRIFLFGLILIILGVKSKVIFIKNSSFSLFITVIFWFFLEFFCFFLTKTIHFDQPNHSLLLADANFEKSSRKPFWGDFNRNFGKWRNPNDSLKKFRCDDNTPLIYHSNNIGARDIDRTHKNLSHKKRVIFLGDSFVEGIMVNPLDRCSNILEKNTGSEHLNFGINGTGPINYYLIYKTLAKKYEHDIVIVGILPANDFEDYSEADEITLLNFPIYRPFWEKSTLDGYSLKYSLASINQSYSSLAIYDKPNKIYKTKDSIYQNLSLIGKIKSEFCANSYIVGFINGLSQKKSKKQFIESTMFQCYPKHKWNTFTYSLKKLVEETKEKQVILITIPTLKDITIFQKNKKNELASKLSTFCKENNLNYIDLLPEFSKVNNPKILYVECDGHWNEKGEKYAAQIIQNNEIYKKLLMLQ